MCNWANKVVLPRRVSIASGFNYAVALVVAVAAPFVVSGCPNNLPFCDLSLRNNNLGASTADGAPAISLGKVEAEKWLHALNNPKSHAEKLSLKVKMRLHV